MKIKYAGFARNTNSGYNSGFFNFNRVFTNFNSTPNNKP